MERWVGRVALVTGASAGIGYSVTKALVERGMKVVACARNIAAIQKLGEELSEHPGSLTAVKCDVSKEEEVTAMFQMIRQHSSLGRVDVCINNAGLAHDAPLLTGDPAQWKHMFDVNVLGLMMVTKESFKLMQENNIDDGHIILVNSVAGKTVSSFIPSHCYSATKFAVSALCQGMRNELRALKSRIRISQVCPGMVETEFAKRFVGEEDAATGFSILPYLKADDVSDSILYILGAPPHVEVNDVVILPTEETS
ncbi:dehydrogenase/reductase SDR family member 11-like [Babylonia areolata]|uniref:dehydrogenase/reductase SDR family member 11-like n=1 Tax=Babylonia areolata TaxID=304850 RepID=UPI003FD10FE3